MVQLEVLAQTVQRKKQKLKFWLLFSHQNQQLNIFDFQPPEILDLIKKFKVGEEVSFYFSLDQNIENCYIYCVTARIHRILQSQPEAMYNWLFPKGW